MSDTFTLIEGDTGSGKSATMASWAIDCAQRNRNWYMKALAVWERERDAHSCVFRFAKTFFDIKKTLSQILPIGKI